MKMKMKMKQHRHIKKSVIMSLMKYAAYLMFAFGLYNLFNTNMVKVLIYFLICSNLLSIRLNLKSWAKKPYKTRVFVMTVHEKNGQFPEEMKNFNKSTKTY